MIKVGLIGAGVMGRTHRDAYTRLKTAQLKTICDHNLEKAKNLAGPNVKVTMDYQEILRDPEIDVVDVCVPTYLHKEVVLAAAAAGKHVFCEKPIALTVEDAKEMIGACEKAGIKLGVGQVVRFFPDYSKVKALLESGRIGEAKVVRTTRSGAFPIWPEDNWYADYSKSGGPIIDLMIHDLDWLLWLFGPVERVFAKTVRKEEAIQERFDHALVTLRFKSGLIAHLEASWAQPQGSPFITGFEIAGTKGLYQYSKDTANPIVLRTAEGEKQAKSVPQSPLALEPYTAQLKAFFTALAEGNDVPVPGREAQRALEVALAARHSARNGEVVWLGGKQDD